MLCCIEGKAAGEKKKSRHPSSPPAFKKTQINKTTKSKAQNETGWDREIIIMGTDAHRTLDKNNSSGPVLL